LTSFSSQAGRRSEQKTNINLLSRLHADLEAQMKTIGLQASAVETVTRFVSCAGLKPSAKEREHLAAQLQAAARTLQLMQVIDLQESRQRGDV